MELQHQYAPSIQMEYFIQGLELVQHYYLRVPLLPLRFALQPLAQLIIAVLLVIKTLSMKLSFQFPSQRVLIALQVK